MFRAIAITKDAHRVEQRPWGLSRVFLEVKAMTRLRLGRRLAVLFSILALSACATTIKSTVDVADSADFAGLNTYAWMTDLPTIEQWAVENDLNPLQEQRIRAAVETELEHKGYRKAARDEADFVVLVRLDGTDQEFYGSNGYNYDGYYPGYRHYTSYRHGFGHSRGFRTRHREGDQDSRLHRGLDRQRYPACPAEIPRHQAARCSPIL